MFIGRQRELALLDDALEPGASVALVGASGMGKSELARAFSAGRETVWVECGDVSEDELRFRILAASNADDELTLEEALAGAELLVLDDWDPGLSLDRIRAEFPGAILVSTPVAPDDVPTLPVPPFDVPNADDLADSDAFRLFSAAANSVRLGAASDFEPHAVLDIVERVAGHPLGIVLAGRHAASVGAGEVARLLQSGTELADTGRVPRQRSMALALEFSWNQLNDREQTILFLASCFDRSVRVVTLADFAGIEVSEALEAIRTLTQCGAVRPGPFPRPVRIWSDIAPRLFRDERVDDARQLTNAIFDRALGLAHEAARQSTVGPIDDTPSIWEAALADYESRDREEVGLVVRALLKWAHRFAPRRYLSSKYLEDIAVWSGNADALLLRVSMYRGNAEEHRAAIDAANPALTRPADQAMLHFERAMRATIDGDRSAALGHLENARACAENYAAMLLEVALRMAHGDDEAADELLTRLEQIEPPSPGHAIVAAHHRAWLLPPGERLEYARKVKQSFEGTTVPRILIRSRRTLADVLERDHQQHDEARELREETFEIASGIDHAKGMEDARCELAWGAFCAGDIEAARRMSEVDPALLTAETRLRYAGVIAMLACLDSDGAAARLAASEVDRNNPPTPNMMSIFDVVDAAIAIEEEKAPEPGPMSGWMVRAAEARTLGHRDQIALFDELRELREMRGWAPRFAMRWIEVHGSPFLQRLSALQGRPERVVVLSDGSGLLVDDAWHHVPETSAAMLTVLATGRPVTFEELKDAAWPEEVATWDAIVNRINVRISKLRGMGLKPVLHKTSDGFVLDCSIYVEP